MVPLTEEEKARGVKLISLEEDYESFIHGRIFFRIVGIVIFAISIFLLSSTDLLQGDSLFFKLFVIFFMTGIIGSFKPRLIVEYNLIISSVFVLGHSHYTFLSVFSFWTIAIIHYAFIIRHQLKEEKFFAKGERYQFFAETSTLALLSIYVFRLWQLGIASNSLQQLFNIGNPG